MKKLFFLLPLLCSIQLQAQTKEETVEWINVYGKKIIDNHSCFVNGFYLEMEVTESQLTMNQFYSNEKRGILSIRFDELYYLHPDSLYARKVRDGGYAVRLFCKLDKAKEVNLINNTETFRSEFSLYACSEKEVKQLAKAIMHLASFYGALPKPRVNKDTF